MYLFDAYVPQFLKPVEQVLLNVERISLNTVYSVLLSPPPKINWKNHPMRTLFINKLAPTYNFFVLAQESVSLNEAVKTARSMLKS
jgi:hypothetical protein